MLCVKFLQVTQYSTFKWNWNMEHVKLSPEDNCWPFPSLTASLLTFTASAQMKLIIITVRTSSFPNLFFRHFYFYLVGKLLLKCEKRRGPSLLLKLLVVGAASEQTRNIFWRLEKIIKSTVSRFNCRIFKLVSELKKIQTLKFDLLFLLCTNYP